ncbi:uncharacterized protein E5676_scaffold403G00320 [Cucumis melo var. makuwa]|uniref:Uncharacterized protein n=1 Tax=Cucumis melo var. makuwa TaxID=1194695 RepID=A0A5D3DZF4_CUCMM|nr:uncharacterized protein E6C27_scaffold114G00620 [Cucumis melo var. makuwa]TYK28715.1 uncharacterized protein E5676_scaffold403G00320 [Cucumis melo var. makuwa]
MFFCIPLELKESKGVEEDHAELKGASVVHGSLNTNHIHRQQHMHFNFGTHFIMSDNTNSSHLKKSFTLVDYTIAIDVEYTWIKDATILKYVMWELLYYDKAWMDVECTACLTTSRDVIVFWSC